MAYIAVTNLLRHISDLFISFPQLSHGNFNSQLPQVLNEIFSCIFLKIVAEVVL